MLNASQFSKEWVMKPVDDQGNVVDYVVLWEASNDHYVNDYKAIDDGGILVDPPDWWASPQYTDRISHTIFLCSDEELQSTVDLSQARNAGNIYVYDRDANQRGVGYGFLPSYWDREVSLLMP